jgi:hypothetical protein
VNSRLSLAGAFALALPLLSGCGLLDLAGLSCSTFPGRHSQVIEPDASLRVRFSRPVVRENAEGSVRLTNRYGEVAGTFDWEGHKELRLTPETPLPTEIRHTLSVSGTIAVPEGAEYRLEHTVPFYAGSSRPPLRLVSSIPGDGGMNGTAAALVLRFSEALDRSRFQEHFELSPDEPVLFDWNSEGDEVTVLPPGGWTDLEQYQWEIEAGDFGAGGLRLAERVTGTFFVQEDTAAPRIISVSPYRSAADGYVPSGGSLAALRNGEYPCVEFNEEVDRASVKTAVTVSPRLHGEVRAIGESRFLYLYDGLLAPEREYTLRITEEIEDRAGTRMQQEISRSFVSGVPELTVERIGNSPEGPEPHWNGEVFSDPDPRPITVNAATGNSHSFTVTFSAPFRSYGGKRRAEDAVEFCSFFPPDLPDPETVSRSWLNDRSLTITCRDVSPGNGSCRYYYLLAMKGGAKGARNEAGSYPLDDLRLYVYAEAE